MIYLVGLYLSFLIDPSHELIVSLHVGGGQVERHEASAGDVVQGQGHP